MASSLDVMAALNDVKWAALVLIGALAFWVSRWLGGGDVKLIVAASLLVGAQALPNFLLLTVLLGGGLALLAFGDMWFERNYGWSTGLAFPRADLAVRDSATAVPHKASVPYGIAIALACVATILATLSAIW
jgi:Flp pilus assembly protein protease CpaA